MNLISIKTKIKSLHAGTHHSPLLPPHSWATVEPWITEYLSSNPAEIRSERIKGLDCTPKAVFARIAESTGCQVQFLDEGVSFNFIQ